MAKDSYGETQVRELRLDRRELERLAIDSFRHQGHMPYDFDYANPITIWERDGNLILRFVQQKITRQTDRHELRFKSIEQIQLEEAASQGK